jgi:exosortase
VDRTGWTLATLLLLAFAPALLAMAEVWWSVDWYSHGFLVPVVAFAVLHANRERLGTARHDRRGYLLVAAGLAIYAAGLAAGSPTLQGLAFVLTVAGLVLRRWGLGGLRRAAFPVGFLLFMVPLPTRLLTPVIVTLQLLVSRVSIDLLQALGVTVMREGNVIVVPGGELFLAEACSGITSIVTLLPLAVLLAYFTERSWEWGLGIVAAVIPLALLANLARVVATVLAARVYGVERAAQHTLHELGGLLTFVLACLGLLAVASLLRHLRTAHGHPRGGGSVGTPGPEEWPSGRPLR